MTSTPLNILRLDSSARASQSVSRKLSDRVVARYTHAFPDANLVARDLAEGLTAIDQNWIGATFTPGDDRSEDQKALLAESDVLLAELRAADVLVIGAPVYNFNVPSSLKAWIDLVCRAGETFRYTESGPEGLLKGKRAIITIASGGVPLGSPLDFTTPYLTHVLNFIGIAEISYVSASGVASDAEAAIKSAETEIDALSIKWHSAA